MNFISKKECVKFNVSADYQSEPIYFDWDSLARGIPDGLMRHSIRTKVVAVGVFHPLWGEVEFEQLPAEIFVVTSLGTVNGLTRLTAELNQPIVGGGKKIKNHKENH